MGLSATIDRAVGYAFVRGLLALAVALTIAACGSTRTIAPPSDPVIARVLADAEDQLGTGYCSAGATPDCFDCSGFVSWCFGRVGITLPRRSQDQYTAGSVVARSSLRPGDLVFFRTTGRSISHVGIMADTERFIHASTSSGVMISRLDDTYWKPRYVGARRVRQ